MEREFLAALAFAAAAVIVSSWALRDRRPVQRTSVHCPNCRFEMVAGGELIADDDEGVRYRCERCGLVSRWYFDAPVPVLIGRYWE